MEFLRCSTFRQSYLYFLIFQPEDILKLCSIWTHWLKRTNTHPFWQTGLLNGWAVLWEIIYLVHLTLCFYHVTYAFYIKSTLCSCVSAKELFARRRPNIWSLSDCNLNQTHYYLVRKRTLNHLAKLAKWFRCVVSTYLYGAFECVFLSFDCPLQSLKLQISRLLSKEFIHIQITTESRFVP